MRRRRTNGPLKLQFLAVILAMLVLPVISYTLYQLWQRQKDVDFIQNMYERQLNTLLFSVNQYCWDAVRSLASELSDRIQADGGDGNGGMSTDFGPVINRFSYVEGAGIQQKGRFLLQFRGSASSKNFDTGKNLQARVDSAAERMQNELQTMAARAEKEYIQLVPVKGGPSSDPIELIFIPMENPLGSTKTVYTGVLLVNRSRFVEDVAAPRLNQLDTENFVYGVKNVRNGNLIFPAQDRTGKRASRFFENAEISSENGTGHFSGEFSFERKTELWVLPDLELLIGLRGRNLSQTAQNRVNRNLILLGIMNGVLILGLVLAVFNLKREWKLARMKSDFAASVSHELRTPLAMIRLYGESLEMNRIRDENKKKEYLRTIAGESARLTRLINNILDFSKIESRKKEYHFQLEDPEMLVRETADLMRFPMNQKNIRFRKEIGENIPMIWMDRETAGMALMNLLDNAAKFSPENGKIRLSLKKEDSNVIIAVTDQGAGIPKSEQKKIFEKFYRMENTLTQNVRGSGLGLSLVKHIMEAHGGQVRLQSSPGKGSTFSLVFPLRDSSERDVA